MRLILTAVIVMLAFSGIVKGSNSSGGKAHLKKGFYFSATASECRKDYKLYQDFCLREGAACFVTKGVARVIPCSTSGKNYSDLSRGGTNDISNYSAALWTMPQGKVTS